jgi:hypothetical protein
MLAFPEYDFCSGIGLYRNVVTAIIEFSFLKEGKNDGK